MYSDYRRDTWYSHNPELKSVIKYHRSKDGTSMCLQILFWCKISKPFKLRTSLFAMFSLTAVKEFQQQQDPNKKRALEST